MILASLVFSSNHARSAKRGTRLSAVAALAVVLLLGLIFIIPVSAAPRRPAAGAAFAVARQAVTATTAANNADAAPAAVQTGGPASVQTGGPAPVQTGGPADAQGGNAAGNGAAPGATGTTTGAPDSGSWIPWLVGAIIVAGLAGLAVFALRQRATPAPVRATVASAAGPTVTTTAPLEILPEPGPAAPVTEIRCPNCDALNPANRRYCDECGQDLRPATAAATATPIPEVDEATTPYLETLSRVDEQLEFVLARNVVKIGRALDNDIVIDDQFMGWQTVSPHHARLTRQPEGFLIEDLNSENGTFVNSARTGQNLLEDGMTLAFGKVEFIYRVPRE
jgi:hypothetical protein